VAWAKIAPATEARCSGPAAAVAATKAPAGASAAALPANTGGVLSRGASSAISTAQTNQTTAQSMVTQAENVRQQASGVDLNQEAVTVMQFQRAYDAAAKMVNVLDQLTQDVVNMIPSA